MDEESEGSSEGEEKYARMVFKSLDLPNNTQRSPENSPRKSPPLDKDGVPWVLFEGEDVVQGDVIKNKSSVRMVYGTGTGWMHLVLHQWWLYGGTYLPRILRGR